MNKTMRFYKITKLFGLIEVIICSVRKFFSFYLPKIFRSMNEEYSNLFGMSLKQWFLYQHRNIIFDKCYWMGVRAMKNPLDAWIYQEIIYEVKPDIIIEIGSAEGGSTLYFANLLDLLGKGIVISIDIDRTKYHIEHGRITIITGNSSSPDIISKVSNLCNGKCVLVVHDGDHRKESVLKDLRPYSTLVSVNSYFIVEDGVADLFQAGDGIGMFEEGPLKAIEEFLVENHNFIVDKERERYILTYNPKGFLKRIR